MAPGSKPSLSRYKKNRKSDPALARNVSLGERACGRGCVCVCGGGGGGGGGVHTFVDVRGSESSVNEIAMGKQSNPIN